MIDIRSQPTPEGLIAPIDDEICDQVLGMRLLPNYATQEGGGELGFWKFKINLESQGLSNKRQVSWSEWFKQSEDIRCKSARKKK